MRLSFVSTSSRWLSGVALVTLLWGMPTVPANAFISAPVGGRAGQVDVSARVGLERGLIEPNENSDSWQKARWNLYTLGLGYTIGDVEFLRDLFVRVDATFFTSPAEVNERAAVPQESCLGQALSDERCRFHAEDQGAFISLSAGFNLIHKPAYALGVFAQGTVPIDVNLDKFANPRIDYLAAGMGVGVRLSPSLTHETRIYLGTGPFGPQNATIALTQLFGAEASYRGWKPGLKLGTYFDADLTERFDRRYDAAYTPGFPDARDRVRMMRFGVLISPYVVIADRFSVELGYLQKLFGYDAPATRFLTAGVRAAF